MTTLQKSWLKALSCDKRIKLFLDETQIDKINTVLDDVPPLYENSDFHYFDAAVDGDRYDDEQYIRNFRDILSAIKDRSEINVEYDSGKGKVILNLLRIKSVSVSQNALERYMLQFASMEKQTEYDEATDSYICHIFYDRQDETELLIRILIKQQSLSETYLC